MTEQFSIGYFKILPPLSLPVALWITMKTPVRESALYKAYQAIAIIVLLAIGTPALIGSFQGERRMYIEKRAMAAKSKAHGTLFATYFGCMAAGAPQRRPTAEERRQIHPRCIERTKQKAVQIKASDTVLKEVLDAIEKVHKG